VDARQTLISGHVQTGGLKQGDGGIKIFDLKRGMGLARRGERGLHAQMQPDRPRFKPDAPALCKGFGFGDPHHPQYPAVEAFGQVFGPVWHGKLNVVQGL
jgi:hypothetical protein